VGVYGHGTAVVAAGYDLDFVVVSSPPEMTSVEFPVHFLDSAEVRDPANVDWLWRQLEKLRPDVVWIHQTHVWPLFAPLRGDYPHALLSGDPEWQIATLRPRFSRLPRNPVKKLVHLVRRKALIRDLRRKEYECFQQAAERGVLAGWSALDVVGMRERTGRAVHLCPLAFPDWGLRPELPPDAPPSALLLGNMNGIQTRDGLRHFFDEVWPAWREDRSRPRSQVRVVGGGRLPDHFKRPRSHDRLNWIGFAPSVEEEWKTATALLVPVTIKIGFRTRIVEAWCRGVPVISHPSAEAGLPQMRAGVNYLAAETPDQWIVAMCSLEKDREKAASLANKGRETYLREFSVEAGAKRFGKLTELAIVNFKGLHEKSARCAF